jgi:hypothetical protein
MRSHPEWDRAHAEAKERRAKALSDVAAAVRESLLAGVPRRDVWGIVEATANDVAETSGVTTG